MEKFKITFYPDNKSIEVDKDKTLLSAAISAGIYINSSCGGDGVCGKCKVLLKKGKVITQPTGIISQEEHKKGIYLACLTSVQSDLEIEIPPESRISLEGLTPEQVHERIKGFYSDAQDIKNIAFSLKKERYSHSPLTTKLVLNLPAADLNDKISDLERVFRQLKQTYGIDVFHTGLANIRQLSELLRSSGWKATVTLGKRDNLTELLLVEPDDTTKHNFGFAFDIGTTTITGQLIDLNSGKILGTKATYNRQISFGSDVITRIIHAQDQEGLQELHVAVIDCIGQIIQQLAGEHKIDLNDATCMVCAGNTTMMHLLLCIDPTYIRKEPYVPTANYIPILRASEIGIRINPRGLLYCVPGVASYIGGDVTAGVLSCRMDKEKDLCLLIDIGTNGEIVLGNRDFLISCAASAGPAFEGSGVSCGMRATQGAMQKIKINPSGFMVKYDTIGSTMPKGICGSGYIDALAQMLKCGIIDRNGKINSVSGERIRNGEFGKEFILETKEKTLNKQDIVINEADIDNIKRAKAAIFSGISALMKHMGTPWSELSKIFVAGGFGTYLDIANATEIGLLPDLPKEKFIFVGNSSVAGAKEIILSLDAYWTAEDIARKLTYFELSAEPGYMEEYVAALFFPHTDLKLFPSVKL